MSKIVFIPGFVATVTTIVIDNTPIVGGASGRILFENATNQISESPNFTYLAGIFNVTKTATHQAQFSFDANNYFRIKATSTGATELSATGTAPKFLFNADVDAQTNKSYAAGIGVGTITPAAILEVLGTTQQARFSYNVTNYLGITIASNGSTTFSLTGTTPSFTFSQTVNFGANLVSNVAQTWTLAAAVSALNIQAGLFNINTTNKRIGINNATPQATLDVITLGTINLRLQSSSPSIQFDYNASGQRWVIGSSVVDDNFFYANGSNDPVFRIESNGKVAINLGGTLNVPVLATAFCEIQGTTEQLRLRYNSTKYASLTVSSTGNLLIGLTGTTPRTTFSQGINVQGTIRLNGYTVATLPAGVIGDKAYVTDALAPVFLGIIAGGGAVVTPVFYNGANWIAQ